MEDVLEITNQDDISASQCAVRGLRMRDQLERGETVYFTAVGNGMENDSPIQNDIRWVPYSFGIGKHYRYFMFDFTESICITCPGEHIFHVNFRKEYYDGYNWMPVDRFRKLNILLYVR